MTLEFIDQQHPLYMAVKKLGRKYASTLGFMPEGGFDDYAAARCIITASEEGQLLGYLMYRVTGRYGRVAIVHLAIDEPNRGKGLSTLLLDTLRDRYKDSGSSGLVLNCRTDYANASAMWERYGFVAKRTRRSRSLEEHYLTTWCYDFPQRDLFSMAYEECTKVRAMLDLNVLVKLRDAEKRGTVRLEAKEDPRCLLADWLVEETELCFAPEVFNEVYRDQDMQRRQETVNYVMGAFTQAKVGQERMKEVAAGLRDLLPGKSKNAESDRKQVASCVAAEISYFITFDAELIKKKEEIKARYDVEIYTPQEFLLRIDQLLHSKEYAPVLLRGVAFHSVNRQQAEGLQLNTEAFLLRGQRERKTEFENRVMGCVNSGGEVFTVNAQGDTLAFYGTAADGDTAILHFLRLAEGAMKTSLMCQIVTNTLQECVNEGRKRIEIKESYLDDEQKNTLLRFGFLAQTDGTFVKHIKDEIVTKAQLPQVLAEAGLTEQQVPTEPVPLVRMERMFYPLKISDLDIPTYIIPIKANWAGQLFDSVISGEMLFGAIPSKLWSIENVYYRHKLPVMEEAPARILWYVSQRKRSGTHSKAVVASSYLTEVHTGKAKELFRQFKHYGIYQWSDLDELRGGDADKDIKALRFSHTELFPKPVGYEKVQQILLSHGKARNTFNSPLMVTKEIFMDIYTTGKQKK